MERLRVRRSVAVVLAAGSVIAAGAVPAMAQESLTVTVPTLAPGQIAPGVKIAGVDVGGLGRADARAQVLRTHVAPRLKPVVVVHRGKRIAIRPASVGYAADVDYALTGALLFGRSREVPAEGVNVPLRQSVDRSRLERVLVARVARFDVAPRDAAFSLRGTTPVVREARPGVELNVPRSVRILSKGLVKRTRSTFKLPARRTRADITTLAPAIIIDRGNFRLTLWKHRGTSQVYPIAVGTSSHPTPVGNFEVIQKQVNPTWFPPSSPWAAGLGPVPPGPGNPLGTRWIGTSAPAIGIHGTPVPSSIGTRASHGCIRMYIRDVERLYPQVDYGTRVYIR